MNIRLLKLPTRESVSPKSTTSVCLNAFTVLIRAVQRKQAARVLDLQLSSTLPKDTAERFLLKAVNREQHLPQCSDVNIFTIFCRENKFQAVLCILYCAVPLFYCSNNTISRILHKKCRVSTNFKDNHQAFRLYKFFTIH